MPADVKPATAYRFSGHGKLRHIVQHTYLVYGMDMLSEHYSKLLTRLSHTPARLAFTHLPAQPQAPGMVVSIQRAPMHGYIPLIPANPDRGLTA